jgi:hypothetical protein
MFDHMPPPEEPRKSPASRPLIGLAISICLVVVSVMTGFQALCGPSTESHGPSNFFFQFAVVVACASAICGLICFIWLIYLFIDKAFPTKD